VGIWGKNLTDKEYYSVAAENLGASGDATAPAAPRTYGVDISYKF